MGAVNSVDRVQTTSADTMDDHVQALADIVEQLQNESTSTWGIQGVRKWLSSELGTILLGPVSSNPEQYRSLMGQLESMIRTLNDATEHTRAIMDTVHVTTDNAASALKNVHSIPNEILIVIFKLANEDKSKSDFPFHISQVNRRFRAIALRTPILWSYLWPDWTWYKVRLYLERSNMMGLTIHIRNGERLRRFMQIVSAHSNRWHKVIFDFPEEERTISDNGNTTPWEQFCHKIPKDLFLPNLNKIDFQGVPLLLNNDQFPFATWNMPNLQEFFGRSLILPANARSLTECSLLLKGSNISLIDGSQLCIGLTDLQACKSLHISFGPFHNCTNFLSEDPDFTPSPLLNLVHFSAKIWHTSQYKALQDIFNIDIFPEQLVSLELDYSSLENISEFLNNYRFESLERLSLWYAAGDGLESDTFTLPCDLMPVLKHIQIASEDAQMPLAFSLFSGLPRSLETITFYQCHAINRTYLSFLVGTLANPMYNQNFKSLKLIECKIPDEYLTQMRAALPGKMSWSKPMPRRGWL